MQEQDKQAITTGAVSTDQLPRVLIIGQTFTSDTGGGITLSNLFKDWPAENIAVAVESKEAVKFDRAHHYFRLGFEEQKMPFPFNIFQRKTKSGPISENISIGAVSVKKTGKMKDMLKKFFDRFLHFSGLYFWMYGNQRLTADVSSWIKDFKPQVIYFQPNSYKSIKFAKAVRKAFQLPLVTHVMDDWFSFVVKAGPFRSFWRRKIDHSVDSLFAITDLHLSICDSMSRAYEMRYGHKFIAFHNTVDLNFWSRASNDQKLHSPVKILYAGRIGYGLERIILQIAAVVENMNSSERRVQLEIQTRDLDHATMPLLKKHRGVIVSPALPYALLPEKFSAADILLIPFDFDGAGLTFIKYSMPTKVSEYMATGTPILVVAPEETALADYAKTGWAKLCSEPSPGAIKEALTEIMYSVQLRSALSISARETVAKNHNERVVIPKFRKLITELDNNIKHRI